LRVDIRVISATNMNIEENIEKGLFRKDLFYRLNPVTIKIPPLRERKEAIPHLVKHFLKRFSEENNKPQVKIRPEHIADLLKYHWPGNVRELSNVIESGVLFTEDGLFPESHLPVKLKRDRIIESTENARELSPALTSVEKKLIVTALEKHNWNQAKTALVLGVHENTLRRKIKKYDIKKPSKIKL
jgi:two-component system, NtrC family, response regulator AtoC